MIERVLRWTAIGVAVMALVDPTVTLSRRPRTRVSIVSSGGPVVGETLRRDLEADFEVVDGLDPTAAAIVIVGDRYPDLAIPEGANVSTVTIAEAPAAFVQIVRVEAPRAIPPATAVHLAVDVHGRAMRGAASSLVIRSAGAEVGRAEHVWPDDKEEALWRAELDVVPAGAPPFTFTIEVGGGTAVQSVDVAPRLRVLVYEARPSWATAFVRRALEGDARFVVTSLAAPAPKVSVTSGPNPPGPRDLPGSRDSAFFDAFDAIVVGGLDRVPAQSVQSLGTFAVERGGAIVLLPDANVPPSIRALMPPVELRETLLDRPAALDIAAAPKLEASELLETVTLPSTATVIARAPSSPRAVIWSVPAGDGVIVFSGAMDAWRYRGSAGEAFEKFWRSVISGAALAAHPPVAVSVSPTRASSGDRVRVTARVRALERNRLGDRLAVSATAAGAPLRLWPDAQQGVFTGSFIVESADTTAVTASVAGMGATGGARVTTDNGARRATAVPLALLAQTHGGVNVGPADLGRLVRHLRDAPNREPVPSVRRPMRSPLWFAPFAACLSGEWWLRRRRGAR